MISLLTMFVESGAAYVLLTGLASTLAGIICTRIARKENAKLQKQLQEFQAGCDRVVHIHKAQFEKEFATYQTIVSEANHVRRVFFSLHRKIQPIFDTKEEESEHYNDLRAKFRSAFETARNTIQDNMPFVSDEVYELCDMFIDLTAGEITHLMFSRNDGNMPHADMMTFREDVRASCEAIAVGVRHRLKQLVIIE